MNTQPQLLRPTALNALPGIVAGFSTRHGGISEPPFASLNLGLSTADTAVAVQENRRRVCFALGFSEASLAIAGQVHGAEVLHVTKPGLYPGYDGLVTATPEILLAISAADCAAVLLADPVHRVLGACHSGWRGTVANITAHTLEAMEALGAQATHVHAFISPCISTAHFEVGEEVAVQFDETFVQRVPGRKPHIDLKAVLVAQLRTRGVPSGQIHVSRHCTYAETDLFFSYRAEQSITGRMMGVLGLSA